MMFEEREVVEEATSRWWLFLLTGIGWLIVALIVFQWNYTTVYAISILFGVIYMGFFFVNEFHQFSLFGYYPVLGRFSRERLPLLPQSAEARKYLTWILAFIVWWNFIVGELLNNIKGLFP